MTTALAEWLDSQGRGSRQKMMRESLLSLPTIKRAERGECGMKRTAEAISAATGGEVTVLEILGLSPPKGGD